MKVYSAPNFRCRLCHCDLWASTMRHPTNPDAALYRIEHYATGSTCANAGQVTYWNPDHNTFEL